MSERTFIYRIKLEVYLCRLCKEDFLKDIVTATDILELSVQAEKYHRTCDGCGVENSKD